MNTNDKKLRDLPAKLELSEDQVQAAIEDIQQADDLMHRHDQLPVEQAILARTIARVRQEPDSGQDQPHDKELCDLLVKLDTGENQGQAAVDDIRLGDDLMHRYDQLPVDPEILARTKTRVRLEPAPSAPRRTGYGWPQRAAALAASLVIALGLIIFLMPQKPAEPPTDEYIDMYWQQVLLQENESHRKVDDMILAEVLQCWSDVEWDVKDILEPDSDQEPNPTDVSSVYWVNPRLGELASG